MVDGMIVPVADSPTQFPVERRRDDLDPRLDQTASQKALLTPRMAAVAIAHARAFLAEV